MSYVDRTADENGNVTETNATCWIYTVVTSDTTEWSDGWYVVSETVTIGSRVTVSGTVNLILCDGATLTVNGGINVASGNSLTIYGQTEDTGTLTVSGVADYNSGIGGGDEEAGGTITINGGTVIATSNNGGAGIGGGYDGEGGTITINGGTVNATGGDNGSGIGGGSSGAGGTTIINGGTVIATSNNGGAGIGGGGFNGAGGTTTINGGTVTASGGISGAGIGGGEKGAGGTITINGGTVTATGEDYGAGIGGGSSGAGGTLTINGGNVTATGGYRGAGIGGGSSGAGGTTTINGGQVTATGGENGSGIGGGKSGAGGTITLSYTSETDSITASSYNGDVTISDGKYFVDENLKYYGGTLADNHKANAARQTLTPTTDSTVHVINRSGDITSDKAAAKSGETVTLSYSVPTGYNFVNYNVNGKAIENVNRSVQEGNTFTMPNENVTLTVTLDPIIYTISCDLAGGSVSTANPAAYTIESPDFTLTNPTKGGYDFTGWNGAVSQDGAFSSYVTNAETVTIVQGSYGDRHYTATWEITTYTISYDLAGGSIATANPTSYTVESEDFTLTNPTREHYTFSGWTGTGLGAATETVTIQNDSIGNRSYTATWTPITYYITYSLGGGTLPDDYPATYNIESEAFLLTNPERAGYTFTGWTLSGDEEGTASTDLTVPTGSYGDKEYSAGWQIITYTISYDLAGGVLPESSDNPASYTVESEDFTLINPTKNGYTFTGWTGTDLTEASTDVTIEQGSMGDRSYSATWTPIIYTITYDLAGGTLPESSDNPATYTVESEDFTLINPTKEGYTFTGWTGTDLTEASTDVTIEHGSTEDRSYSATWTPITYAITYDLGGGSLPESSDNYAGYTPESDAITITNPTRTGYTFTGWLLSGDESGEVSADLTIPSGSTGDRHYISQWELNTYTITYDLTGGSLPESSDNPASYTVESEDFTLINPTNNGYTFAGWTGTDIKESSTDVTIEQGSTGDRSYSATWTSIIYTISYDLAGGVLPESSDNPSDYTVESDDITLTNPTRAGYTFTGWLLSGDESAEASADLTIPSGSTGDRYYLTEWEIITYTISYDLAGGTADNPAGYTVESEDFTLNNPTRDGYEFAGWTGTSLDVATQTVTISAGSTGDREYTATWTEVSDTSSDTSDTSSDTSDTSPASGTDSPDITPAPQPGTNSPDITPIAPTPSDDSGDNSGDDDGGGDDSGGNYDGDNSGGNETPTPSVEPETPSVEPETPTPSVEPEAAVPEAPSIDVQSQSVVDTIINVLQSIGDSLSSIINENTNVAVLPESASGEERSIDDVSEEDLAAIPKTEEPAAILPIMRVEEPAVYVFGVTLDNLEVGSPIYMHMMTEDDNASASALRAADAGTQDACTFLDDDGNETKTVPANKHVNVAAYMEPGKTYAPIISTAAASSSTDDGNNSGGSTDTDSGGSTDTDSGGSTDDGNNSGGSTDTGTVSGNPGSSSGGCNAVNTLVPAAMLAVLLISKRRR